MIKTLEVMRLLLRWRRTRRVVLVTAVLYGLLYLYAIGDLDFQPGQRAFAAHFSSEPWVLLFKPISAFYFEAIGMVRLPFTIYLVSPLNLAIGAALAVLVGLNLALSYIAVKQPEVCYGHPATGVLAALPGLLAGSVCCGPVILLVLGVQASASLIALFGWLVPIAAALLLATLLVNGRWTNVEYLRNAIG